MSKLTKDGLELSIATQHARAKLGELDVTVSIPGFIDLCQLAIKGIAVTEVERKPATVRNNPDGSLDEIFAEPCQFHIEQMAAEHWWIGVNALDKFYHINLHAKGRIKANVEAEPRHEPVSQQQQDKP